MANVYELKTEIEEIRHLLNAVIADMGIDDCNRNILLDISTRMDKLILKYMKNGGGVILHYEETMQLIEAFKQHPVQGTFIVLLIAGFLGCLIYIDKRKK